MVHKVDSAGAGPGGVWIDGTPAAPGTLWASKWFNMMQDELLAVLVAAGLVPSDASNAQVSAALDIIFGAAGAAALKNKLINGSLQLWQRGTSIAVGAAESYTADRWVATADQVGAGAGLATITREDFAPGQTDVPGDPPYFLRFAQTAAATADFPTLAQRIEDVSTLSNGFATFSFWGRAAAATLVTVRIRQRFGAGGSGDVLVGAIAVPISTTWTRQQVTFAIPSVAGKTIGPGSYLALEVVLPATGTFTIDFVDAQAEPGQNATPVERRAIQLEYNLAARYFEKSVPEVPGAGASTRGYLASAVPNYEGGATEARFVTLGARFRARKRASPTVTWYAAQGSAPLAGKLSQYDASGAFTANKAVAQTLDASESETGHPATAGNSSGVLIFAAAEWTADAEL